MTPAPRPVAGAHHDVRVYFRLGAVECNVADEGENLHLLGQRDALVILLLPVEVA